MIIDKRTGKINKHKQDLIDRISYELFKQYYLIENHSRLECYEHFNLTDSEFTFLVNYYNLKKGYSLRHLRTTATKIDRYGDPRYNNREQSIQTCLEKFGVESPLASPAIRHKGYMSCYERYGATGFGLPSAEERKQNAKKANSTMWHLFHTDETYRLEYLENQRKTKAKNKSFNQSKIEKWLYTVLCEKFGVEDIIRQYSDERYPFNCDFYIRSKDLFIEVNAHWTHNTHPFDSHDTQDLTIYRQWQEKAQTSKFYRTAIQVWTVRDPLKYRSALDHKLNYIMIYTQDIKKIEGIINEI